MSGLYHVKAGDDVLLRGGGRADQIKTVDRVTATQIIVGTRRYNRKTGMMIGRPGWDSGWLVADDERVEAARVKRDLLNVGNAIRAWVSEQDDCAGATLSGGPNAAERLDRMRKVLEFARSLDAQP